MPPNGAAGASRGSPARLGGTPFGVLGGVPMPRENPMTDPSVPVDAHDPGLDATPLAILRRLCLALPEAREVEAWGAPTFRVKTMFAGYSDGSMDKKERPNAWIKAEAPGRDFLVRAEPGRFFVPPYVGVKGWVGVFLDDEDVDWAQVRGLLWDAWRMSAPRKLVAAHPEPPEGW